MKEYDLQKLINDPETVEEKIKELMENRLLSEQEIDREEVNGHILKAEHNLKFITDAADKKYFDWA